MWFQRCTLPFLVSTKLGHDKISYWSCSNTAGTTMHHLTAPGGSLTESHRHGEYVVGFPRWVTVWGLPSSVGDTVRLAVGAINVGLLAWLAFAPHTESRVAACAVSSN